jgi:hypothetical protein
MLKHPDLSAVQRGTPPYLRQPGLAPCPHEVLSEVNGDLL